LSQKELTSSGGEAVHTNSSKAATESISDLQSHGVPNDLAAVLMAWGKLPDAVRADILATVAAKAPPIMSPGPKAGETAESVSAKPDEVESV
jgi:hypothetical protein